MGVVLPGANSYTSSRLELDTKTSPLASVARASGPFMPVRVAVGVVCPGANSLTVRLGAALGWPQDQMVNVQGIGWYPTFDVADANYSGSDLAKACQQIVKDSGQQLASAYCEPLFFIQFVLNHASEVSTLGGESAHDLFMTCYPFHPSVLSVFERKWQSLPRFQRTRSARVRWCIGDWIATNTCSTALVQMAAITADGACHSARARRRAARAAQGAWA